jgi:acetyltransferase-like isoleucine patch superfamily enzyme
MSPLNRQGNQAAWERIRFYLEGQSTGWMRYVIEQTLFLLCGWIPGIAGIGLRAVLYKLILHCQGWVAIESGVRLAQPQNITLHRGSYLDCGAYLHACPEGIEIGENTYIMHHAELHVYNFRQLPHAGIRIGHDSLIGEFNVIRGQGGVTIGNRVYTAPLVQILAVNHVFSDPTQPFISQGITAQGIVIEDDVWIGAGAIITDGVHIAQGAVIGAGAVVTHDVAAHTLVAGVPARVVKEITADQKDQKLDQKVYL